MKRFRVYLGASEPAAYAISALEGFGLEPKEIGKKVAYGVFDFGGGTTDFDFGIEYIPENRRRNFIIEQFGFNGDVLLGGENMLELLAYEVYKDNLDIMREKKIPFALPAGCESFAGAETLVSKNKDASAHMNNRILSEKLRPIWENNAERDKLTEDAQSWILFSSVKQSDDSYKVNVNLKIDAAKLDKLIEARIREGVVNFFQSLRSAFEGKDVEEIHIFLAGNSCRSPFVKKIFDEFIENEDGEFILHMPLGMESESPEERLLALADKLSDLYSEEEEDSDWDEEEDSDSDEETIIPIAKEISVTAEELGAKNISEQARDIISEFEKENSIDFDNVVELANDIRNLLNNEKSARENTFELDKQRTGKTGVAFGLLRCRRGGKDVKIIDKDVDGDEPIFQYFLGDAGNDGNTFTVRIDRDIPYGKWTYFTFADEPEFELYYTTAPRALQGKMSAAKVSMIHCELDEDATTDDDNYGVYIRKVSPNEIEYAVGSEEDFAGEFKGKIYKKNL